MLSEYGNRLFTIMPRSEFLTKVQALGFRLYPELKGKVLSRPEFEAEVEALVGATKKLEDMDSALNKIEQLNAQQQELGGYNSDSNYVNQLKSLRKSYNDFRTGAATSLSLIQRDNSSFDLTGAMADLKWKLMKFAITRVLQMSDTQGPMENESLPAYLRRMMDIAGKKADWAMMQRILDTAQSLDLREVAKDADVAAFRQLLAGQNMEKAKQYPAAVSSYITALKTGALSIPADKVGEILDAIKRDHPEEYDAGVQMAFENPVDPYGRFVPGSRPSNYDPLSKSRNGRSKEGVKIDIPAVKKDSSEPKEKAAESKAPPAPPPAPKPPEDKPQ